MTGLTESTSQVANLPVTMRAGNLSPSRIVQESEISAYPLSAVVSALLAHIEAHPELVGEWLRYSEDQRVSEGWYVGQEGGVFIVGHAPPSTSRPRREFTGGAEACVAFIAHSFLSPT